MPRLKSVRVTNILSWELLRELLLFFISPSETVLEELDMSLSLDVYEKEGRITNRYLLLSFFSISTAVLILWLRPLPMYSPSVSMSGSDGWNEVLEEFSRASLLVKL